MDVFRPLWRFIVWRPTRRGLSLIALVATAAGVLYQTRHAFDNPPLAPPSEKRHDGNGGHVTIDFGGQWLMGRMIALGRGRDLYHRVVLREVLVDALPRGDEPPEQERSDADLLMGWLMGRDPPDDPDGIGGALYPPTHALLFTPVGYLPPREAYFRIQVFGVFCVMIAAAAAEALSRGRLWAGVVGVLLFQYPGVSDAIGLGQNAPLTLAILLTGWALDARGRPILGGLVWGLLAFKPVWAVALLPVPLMTRRWRMLAAMAGGGALFILLTLPFVGVPAWLEWLAVGKMGAARYPIDHNWVFLSRDLQNLLNRWLIDFTHYPEEERYTRAAERAGWAVWWAVFLLTYGISYHRRSADRATGQAAAFLQLGACLTCYRYMYYDLAATALPVVVASADWPRMMKPLAFTRPGSDASDYHAAWGRVRAGGVTLLWNPVTPILVGLALWAQVLLWRPLEFNFGPPGTPWGQVSTNYTGQPWTLFAVLLLWAWWGWRTATDSDG